MLFSCSEFSAGYDKVMWLKVSWMTGGDVRIIDETGYIKAVLSQNNEWTAAANKAALAKKKKRSRKAKR